VELAARIASAQLQGRIRSRRQIVAGPLVGLLHEEDVWYLSGAVAADPGKAFDPEEVPWALETIRQAFAAESRWLSVELIEEANPGLAEVLAANGMTIASRPPLLAVEAGGLRALELPEKVTVAVVEFAEHQVKVNAVAAAAYEADELASPFQPDPVNGGSVLVRWDGVPVATAAWTPVAATSTSCSDQERVDGNRTHDESPPPTLTAAPPGAVGFPEQQPDFIYRYRSIDRKRYTKPAAPLEALCFHSSWGWGGTEVSE
jgi:hypothetical protein